MGEGIKWEVGPILRGRSRLKPGEGKAAARVSGAQLPMVWCMAAEGRGLHRRRDPRRRRVDFRGGAYNPQAGQAALVGQEENERWEAGLDSQHIRGR